MQDTHKRQKSKRYLLTVEVQTASENLRFCVNYYILFLDFSCFLITLFKTIL